MNKNRPPLRRQLTISDDDPFSKIFIQSDSLSFNKGRKGVSKNGKTSTDVTDDLLSEPMSQNDKDASTQDDSQ